MAEVKHETTDGPIAGTDTFTHRQLLSSIDGNAGSGSDLDTPSDDEIGTTKLSQGDKTAGDLIGVSISQAQTYMKSVETPAAEKAQALEASRGYFGNEQVVDEHNDGRGPSLARPMQNQRLVSPNTSDAVPSPWRSQPEHDGRSSIARAILGNGNNQNRGRSSSGPSAILDGIRKMFADFPSYPGFGSNASTDDGVDSDGTRGRTDMQIYRDRSRSTAQPSSQQSHSTGLDGAIMSSEQLDLRPKPLRRSTSDHSLYLRRAATGASKFDDTHAYSNVADMPNPRFKAITDSLADSSMKLPKLPSINFANSRPSYSKTTSETTKRNTAFNSGTHNATSGAADDGVRSEHPRAAQSGDKKHPNLNEALSNLSGDVVFMGGYRGSVLRSAEPPYQQLWVPVKVGLNLRKVDLEVGLTREDEEKMKEKIAASGILSHIGPIDIARRLLKKVRKSVNAKSGSLRVHDWGYDWRLSPHLLSERLIKFLEQLECNKPETSSEKRGAVVVAHSLGGIITRHAVNKRPELFAGLIYAGAPFGCANILGPLRNGDDVLMSSRVLTAQVNFTFRTSYALLPESGRCFINKDTGEFYDLDFFDINTWDEYHLSPCINPPLPPNTEPQPRKGIVSSVSETLSSLTPSFPNKRASWFLNSTSSDRSPTDSAKNGARDVKDNLESAMDNVQSPKQEVQDSLEPSMQSGSQHKSSVATAVTIPKDQAREYLIRTLAEIKQFKAELGHMPSHQNANRYPPHAIIYGKSVPTVYGAKVASREAIKCSDAFDDLAFAAGDGVVLASSAQLPVGYRCVKGGRVESDRGHIGLLGDLEGIGRCLTAVIEGRRRGIGLGEHAEK